jgi:cell division protein FtsB
MARTKAEVRAYLESVLGQSVDANCGEYQGQCVSLIKGLMNFLGVPNPYAPRGNAKDAANIYLNQGIATNGDGWLRVCVNKDMGLVDGIRYGHIWLDLKDEANFEQNGRTALRTTKNTRPISQALQIVNLDKWITDNAGTPPAGGSMADTISADTDRILQHGILGRNGLRGRAYALDGSTGKVFEGQQASNANIQAWFLSEEGRQWRDSNDANSVNGINAQLDSIPAKDAKIAELSATTQSQQATIADLQLQLTGKQAEIADLQDDIATLKTENEALKKQVKDLEAQVAAGGGDITINFNNFGVIAWTLIKSFGLKKG